MLTRRCQGWKTHIEFVQIPEKYGVLVFNVEIFKALKSLEDDHTYGKVWKNP